MAMPPLAPPYGQRRGPNPPRKQPLPAWGSGAGLATMIGLIPAQRRQLQVGAAVALVAAAFVYGTLTRAPDGGWRAPGLLRLIINVLEAIGTVKGGVVALWWLFVNRERVVRNLRGARTAWASMNGATPAAAAAAAAAPPPAVSGAPAAAAAPAPAPAQAEPAGQAAEAQLSPQPRAARGRVVAQARGGLYSTV
jgi:hypothetical protein